MQLEVNFVPQSRCNPQSAPASLCFTLSAACEPYLWIEMFQNLMYVVGCFFFKSQHPVLMSCFLCYFPFFFFTPTDALMTSEQLQCEGFLLVLVKEESLFYFKGPPCSVAMRQSLFSI